MKENLNEEQPSFKECNLIENNSNLDSDTNSEGSSLGKFKNSDELLKAYQMLEKEFTKKCQKIKELEALNDNEKKSPDSSDNDNISPKSVNNVSKNMENKSLKDMLIETFSSAKKQENNFNEQTKREELNESLNEEQLKEFIFSSSEIRNKFIENYLTEIQSQKTAPLMVNTINSNFCVMPKQKPKSITDAGEYAKEILKN